MFYHHGFDRNNCNVCGIHKTDRTPLLSKTSTASPETTALPRSHAQGSNQQGMYPNNYRSLLLAPPFSKKMRPLPKKIAKPKNGGVKTGKTYLMYNIKHDLCSKFPCLCILHFPKPIFLKLVVWQALTVICTRGVVSNDQNSTIGRFVLAKVI